MNDEIDRFEQALRHRDARRTMLLSVASLVLAGAFVVGTIGMWLLVFVVIRDAETTVRIPVAALWGPPIGVFLFGAAGIKGLSDGIKKRRHARLFDEELRAGRFNAGDSGSPAFAQEA